jgi:hypothetical protein
MQLLQVDFGGERHPHVERGLVMTLGAFVAVARSDGIVISTSRTTKPSDQLCCTSAWPQVSSVPSYSSLNSLSY